LADQQALVGREPRQPVEAPDRSDPVRREAIDIGLSRSDPGVRVRLRPQALVRADGDIDAPAELAELPHRVVAHGLLDEVDVARGHRSEVPKRLWNRPAPVRVDSEPGTSA